MDYRLFDNIHWAWGEIKFSPPNSITLCEVIIARYDATPGESEPVHLCNHRSISLFQGFRYHVSNMTSTEGDTTGKTFQVSYVISVIIIYTVTSPFTVQSNVLMIMAVKRRPRPWTNSCYLSSYILWRLFLLFDLRSSVTVKNVHCTFIAVLVMASFLYLIFVWFRESYNDQMYDTPL